MISIGVNCESVVKVAGKSIHGTRACHEKASLNGRIHNNTNMHKKRRPMRKREKSSFFTTLDRSSTCHDSLVTTLMSSCKKVRNKSHHSSPDTSIVHNSRSLQSQSTLLHESMAASCLISDQAPFRVGRETRIWREPSQLQASRQATHAQRHPPRPSVHTHRILQCMGRLSVKPCRQRIRIPEATLCSRLSIFSTVSMLEPLFPLSPLGKLSRSTQSQRGSSMFSKPSY